MPANKWSFIHLAKTADDNATDDVQDQGNEKKQETNRKYTVVVNRVVAEIPAADAYDMTGHRLCRLERIESEFWACTGSDSHHHRFTNRPRDGHNKCGRDAGTIILSEVSSFVAPKL